MAGTRGRPLREAGTIRPPMRFGDDPLLWASWLYYQEGLTQSEIADAMGASRPTVNAYLADARARGIVNISISHEHMRSVTLARALEDQFGLENCLVVPSQGEGRSLIERVGHAAAGILPTLVHAGDTLAITWGRTMLALAQAARLDGLRDVTVVQATGGTTAKIPYSPESCATRLADNIGARCVPISAPAIVSSAQARDLLLGETVVAEQLQYLSRLDRVLFGVSSLRPKSTIHSSGFFDNALQQHDFYDQAVGSLAGQFIDAHGAPVAGPLSERFIGLSLEDLRKVPTRLLVAAGFDKVQPILAGLRGGYVTTLVIDSDTAEGILRTLDIRLGRYVSTTRTKDAPLTDGTTPAPGRTQIKKFLNDPRDVVNEAMEGACAAYPGHIRSIDGSARAIGASAPRKAGKVGIVIGGGAGHEPAFLGFVGQGLADAVAIGNVFSSPPPDRILTCTRFADQGQGVLYIYGNYTGDVMNFDMASELAAAEGIRVRTIRTTDDIASSGFEDRDARRGTAGNVFVFKVAGAASARMDSLDECERLARKANAACHTIGVALEPCSMPETRRPSFTLAEDDLEFGVGVHGEPGVQRQKLLTADRIVDQICDQLFAAMDLQSGHRVAVLVNSLGGTPMIELMVLNRRLQQRLAARGASTHMTLVGHYCTSLDMVGASITLMSLDEELASLLDAPCDGFSWTRS
ncbi:MAG: bifunctional sugar-binding transcriptional regulator/dihydroxyacetone kinase subunit DhaK [Natronohydrobacter sp.]|nr:bifunctional sugar-binding transcriptional regulator/dihydroxyacetone kinase subunit DhaK [Natronohydrobacter sp.]